MPELSVAENIFLGRLPAQGRSHGPRAMNAESPRCCDCWRPMSTRGAGSGPLDGRPAGDRDRQGDHPQAALRHLRRAVGIAGRARRPSGSSSGSGVLRDQGAGVVYISHRLDEVREVADSIVCLRDGQRVAGWPPATCQRRTGQRDGGPRLHLRAHVPREPNARPTSCSRSRTRAARASSQDINFEVLRRRGVRHRRPGRRRPDRGRALHRRRRPRRRGRRVVDGKQGNGDTGGRDRGRHRDGARGPKGPGIQSGSHGVGEHLARPGNGRSAEPG